MSKLRILAAVALLCVVSAVSYYVGYSNRNTKDYEAACLLSDFIRFTTDNWKGEDIWDGGIELENSFDEYFVDVEYLPTKYHHTVKELWEDYTYSY